MFDCRAERSLLNGGDWRDFQGFKRAYGTRLRFWLLPGAEPPGYCHWSLRDPVRWTAPPSNLILGISAIQNQKPHPVSHKTRNKDGAPFLLEIATGPFRLALSVAGWLRRCR